MEEPADWSREKVCMRAAWLTVCRQVQRHQALAQGGEAQARGERAVHSGELCRVEGPAQPIGAQLGVGERGEGARRQPLGRQIPS